LLAALPKAPSKYNPYKNIDLAKYRRDLVIKNLFDNSYIDKKKYNELLNSSINLKKRKKIYLEDARYYVEDVRKYLVENYGFDKIYKQGFTIKTPINLELQSIATESLREGLEKYDRRKGWRGPIMNKKNSDNWNTNLKKYKLEKTIGWDLAIIEKINKFSVEIETENKVKGKIEYKDISWTKKELDKIFKKGDG
jgi:Membrane carboxypeptidase/penicillin-binding protein